MIKLDILSDPVCPWCYVGKTNLDRALEANPDHQFEIEWHPFQLNPEMPVEGIGKRAYLEGKFGGKANVDAMHDRLRDVAKAAGVALDPDKPTKMPNTLNAHRLIHWAGLEGRQTPVVSALMRAYWVEGRDIGDLSVLSAIAAEQGLDAAMIDRLLHSDADAQDIRDRDAHARQRGVTGVPCFIISNQYVVSGAQPPETWAQVIRELNAQDASSEK